MNLTLNMPNLLLLCHLLVVFLVGFGRCAELTFELPDNEKHCYHEEITKGTKSTVEFQVVTGGNYDVDVEIMSPKKQFLYKDLKKQYDTHSFTADETGEYTVCFSNEFSSYSHKLVYVDWQVGDEKPLPGVEDHASAMTQLETSSHSIHENLESVADYQTHHRLRESQGRKRAEDLNTRVLYWSIGETVAILIIGIGQVFVLKNFFSDKKTGS